MPDPYDDVCKHCGTVIGRGHPAFHLNDCGCVGPGSAALALAMNRLVSDASGQFEHPRDKRTPLAQKLLNPGGAESARIRRSYIDTNRDRFLDRS